jgi:hypothetical protein
LDTASAEIVSLCIRRMDVEAKTSTPVFASFFKPSVPMPPEASNINKIFDADLEGMPSFAEMVPAMWAAVAEHSGGRPVVLFAHNGNKFDFPILWRHMRAQPDDVLAAIKAQFPNGVYTADSLPAAREVIVPAPPAGFKLAPLYQFFFNQLPADTHSAEGDVIALVAVLTQDDRSPALLASALAHKVHVADISGRTTAWDPWAAGAPPLMVTRTGKLLKSCRNPEDAAKLKQFCEALDWIKSKVVDIITMYVTRVVTSIQAAEAALEAATTQAEKVAAATALQHERDRYCCDTKGTLVNEHFVQKVCSRIRQHATGHGKEDPEEDQVPRTRSVAAGTRDLRTSPANEAVCDALAAWPASRGKLEHLFANTALLQNNALALNTIWPEVATNIDLFYTPSKNRALKTLQSRLLQMQYGIIAADAKVLVHLLGLSKTALPRTAALAERHERQVRAHRSRQALVAAQAELRRANDAKDRGVVGAAAAQCAVNGATRKVAEATAALNAAIAAAKAEIPFKTPAESVKKLRAAVRRYSETRSKRHKADNEGEDEEPPGGAVGDYAKTLPEIFDIEVDKLAASDMQIDLALHRSAMIERLTQARTAKADSLDLPADHKLRGHHGAILGPKSSARRHFVNVERDVLVKLFFGCTAPAMGKVSKKPETAASALLVSHLLTPAAAKEALGASWKNAQFSESFSSDGISIHLRVVNQSHKAAKTAENAALQKGRREAGAGKVRDYSAEECAEDKVLAAWDFSSVEEVPLPPLDRNAKVMGVDMGSSAPAATVRADVFLEPQAEKAARGTAKRNRNRAHGRGSMFLDGCSRANYVQPAVMVVTLKEIRHRSGELAEAKALQRELFKARKRRSFRQAEEAIKSANLGSGTVAGVGAAYAQRWEAIETLSSVFRSSARAHARHHVHKAKQALIEEIAFCLAPTDDHVLVIGNAYSAGVAGRILRELKQRLPPERRFMSDEYRTSQLDPRTHELLAHPVSAGKDKEGKWRCTRHRGFQQASSDVVRTPSGERYTMLYNRDVASAACNVVLHYHRHVHDCVPTAFNRATGKEELVRPRLCDRQYRVVDGELECRHRA